MDTDEEHDQGEDDRDEGPRDDEDEEHDKGKDGDGGDDDHDGMHPTDQIPMGIFGDFLQPGSYMMGLSGRLKTMLNNIKRTADPTTRLLTLQEP